MKIKSSMTVLASVAAALAVSACGQSGETENAATDAPAAAETPEQVGARVAASMSPQDFKRREIQCHETNAAAKRAGEKRFTPELWAMVDAEPRMDFLALAREARELELTSDDIGNAQRSAIRAPDKPEDITAEYEGQLRECLAISKVANARHGVTQ